MEENLFLFQSVPLKSVGLSLRDFSYVSSKFLGRVVLRPKLVVRKESDTILTVPILIIVIMRAPLHFLIFLLLSVLLRNTEAEYNWLALSRPQHCNTPVYICTHCMPHTSTIPCTLLLYFSTTSLLVSFLP